MVTTNTTTINHTNNINTTPHNFNSSSSTFEVTQPVIIGSKRMMSSHLSTNNTKKSKPNNTSNHTTNINNNTITVSESIMSRFTNTHSDTNSQYINEVNNAVSDVVSVLPGAVVYVNLRIWGEEWYQTLPLLYKNTINYVVKCVYGKLSCNMTKIQARYLVFNEVYTLNASEVLKYGAQFELKVCDVLVTKELVLKNGLKSGR
jgi:hypothetical protein